MASTSRMILLASTLLATPACRSEPAPSGATTSEDVDARLVEAKAITEQFGGELRKALVAAIEAGGPVRGIEACKLEAPKLAAAASREGWTVGRTAVRVRNPANAPRAWQTRGLEQLQAELDAGGATLDPATLEWHELVDGELHYMRAIPMGGLCLSCHGPRETIDAAVIEQLAELYPDDQATGFAVGQLRGAFVLSRRIRDSEPPSID